MAENSNRDELIFDVAVQLATPEERAAYLRQACGDDADMRRRVEGLIGAHEQAGRFMDQPATGAPFGVPPSGGQAEESAEAGTPSERPGDRIGRYKLLEKIGEGGFGVVWMAAQEEPVRRRVALKVIKLGMDTREVIARFEAERQALALMDHPNIAKVHDGGATDAGRPYFVMELVSGIRITDYCDQNHLPTLERLKLFIQVCQAVQHAHQKGIIHRDLKPSNILVSVHDGVPVPKVIDFGIAKATGQQLTDKTLFTRFAQFLGTPAYMSPEQAELTSLDIDTRSDIYSLGVVLYELLTGRTPFDAKELLEAGLDEIRRVIREVEPLKPSARLTEELTRLGAQHVGRRESGQAGKGPVPQGESHFPAFSPARFPPPSPRDPRELQRLVPLLRGDLDWIVMKCLEKDRARRYETATALSADIQLHLNNEPVLARPPSTVYRWQKFARKHRTAVTAAAGFVLLLTVATAVSAGLAIWANRERGKAVAAQNAETAQRIRAGIAEHEAQAKERQARAAETEARESEVKAKESEAEARAVLDFFEQKVLVAARPKGSKGGLGREATIRAAMEKAEPSIDRSFADQPRVEAAIRHAVGLTYHSLGDFPHAIAQLQRALDLRRARLGPDHPSTLATLASLGVVFDESGQLADAKASFEEVLKLCRARYAPDQPQVLSAQHNLAQSYLKLGRVGEALALLEGTLKQRQKTLGTNAPDTLRTMNNLAEAYRALSRAGDAVPLLEQALSQQRAVLDPDDADLLGTINNLALAYRQVGRLADALPLFEETLTRMRATRELDHPRTVVAMGNLAGAYYQARRYSECEPLLEQALDLQRRILRSDSPTLANMMAMLGECRLRLGKYAEAEPVLREYLAFHEKQPANSFSFTAQGLVGAALLGQKKFSDAEQLLLPAYDGLKRRDAQRPDPAHARPLNEAGERLVLLYEAWDAAQPNTGKAEKAAEWKRRLAELEKSSAKPPE